MLTPYATQALAALHRLLPNLAALAVEQADCFESHTTSPSGQPLGLSAAGEEMTVGFAEHHTHFGWHEGDPQDAAAVAAYVPGLQAGQLVVVAWYEGAKFISSVTQQVGQPQPPLTWFQRLRRRAPTRAGGFLLLPCPIMPRRSLLVLALFVVIGVLLAAALFVTLRQLVH